MKVILYANSDYFEQDMATKEKSKCGRFNSAGEFGTQLLCYMNKLIELRNYGFVNN